MNCSNYLKPPANPPIISYLKRRARISEAHALVVASLAGLPVPDEWEHLARPSAATMATLAGRSGA
jgi:hypothetical protein